MKTSTKIIGMLSIAVAMLFACEKGEAVKEESKDQKYSVAMQVPNAKGELENAILVGTTSLLEKALTGDDKVVYLTKAAKSNNLFVPTTGTTGPVDPVNPNDLCWDEITAYYNEHKAEWQAAANQSCKDVLVCLTCPNSGGGLYVLYVIKPNSVKCAPLAEAVAIRFNFSKFAFGDSDFESEKVKSYINK